MKSYPDQYTDCTVYSVHCTTGIWIRIKSLWIRNSAIPISESCSKRKKVTETNELVADQWF